MIDVPIVVIGAGAAGMMAALSAHSRTETLLLTDGPLGRSNSAMAQGGLHVPEADPASLAEMVDDMVRSARLPVDLVRVQLFVAHIPEIVELLRGWGLSLDMGADRLPRKRTAGGLSRPRIVTSGDQIGTPLMALLRRRALEEEVPLRANTQVVDLEPRLDGVRISLASGEVITARRVVIATGGTAFRRALGEGTRTTNPVNENHVMYDRLVMRGARTRHAELFQYQPFGLVEGPDGPPARCVPESLASLGVRLLDRRGRPLCEPGSDRLVVTEAMLGNRARAIQTAAGPAFRLTLDDLPEDLIAAQYPKLARTLTAMGSLGRSVLVHPFLHYQLGGIEVDASGRCSLPGVVLAGEVTGGLHGKNRLMGNGLTDALVNGWEAGRVAASPD